MEAIQRQPRGPTGERRHPTAANGREAAPARVLADESAAHPQPASGSYSTVCSEEKPVLSVVIGTYNRLDLLRQCIDSILDQTSVPLRIYVTDAGSNDGTIEYLEDLGRANPVVIPILKGKRIGQARALNEVFSTVDSEFVCWLSDDNMVVNRSLDTAVAIMRERQTLGMIGLKVKDVVGPYTDFPYIGGISSLGLLNVNQGLIRNNILQELRGFSEEYRDYGIDPDLTARVLFQGWEIAYTREVAVHHYREWATEVGSQDCQERAARHKQSLDIYQKRFHGCGCLMSKIVSRLKRRFFQNSIRVLRRLGYSCTESTLLGYNFRDWQNVFNARFISVFDNFRYRNKAYYLVQKCAIRK